MPRGERVARGTTADIYAWTEGRVLKLFHAYVLREAVDYEAFIGRTVVEAGIAAPHVFEVIQEEDRWGIVYERVLGRVVSDQLRPWSAARYGHMMARAHASLFAQCVPTLPRQRDVLITRVGSAPHLSAHDHERLLTLLDTLPDDDVLCHGDFHPANLISTEKGLMIIDWNDAKRGHPAADVARTLLILRELHALGDVYLPQVMGTSDKTPPWVRGILLWIFRRTIASLIHSYRQEIKRLVPEAYRLVPRWLPVLAAARLHEGQYTQPTTTPQAAQAQKRSVDHIVRIAKQDAVPE